MHVEIEIERVLGRIPKHRGDPEGLATKTKQLTKCCEHEYIDRIRSDPLPSPLNHERDGCWQGPLSMSVRDIASRV